MEVDGKMHEFMLKEEQLNVGWKKYPVFNH